jgi:hypothetical protein
MLKKDRALLVAGLIFAFIAIIHLLRLFFETEVVISGYTLPMWPSLVAVIVASLLSIWMFRAIKKT